MYPVDLHMHTVASTHAYSTLSDYIAEARRKGIKLFAITDHGPDMADAPHPWHFVFLQKPILRILKVKLTVQVRCLPPWTSLLRASMSRFLHLMIKTPIPRQ